MPIRFVHFAMRGYTRSKRTSEETGSVAYLPDRHRCLEGGPPRLGDAVEITCLDLWAPLYPACLQKVGEQPVTNGQADPAKFETLLDQSSVNLRDRRAVWEKTGWQRFDPRSEPYGVEEVRRERKLYSGL